MNALRETGIIVAVRESRHTIDAEDCPTAGEAFLNGPTGSIVWNEVREALQPFTDAIETVKHTFSTDTGCYTQTTTYNADNGDFTQTNQEREERYIA